MTASRQCSGNLCELAPGRNLAYCRLYTCRICLVARNQSRPELAKVDGVAAWLQILHMTFCLNGHGYAQAVLVLPGPDWAGHVSLFEQSTATQHANAMAK